MEERPHLAGSKAEAEGRAVVARPSGASRFVDGITSGMAWLGGVLMLVMMLAIVYAVVMRFVFNRPAPEMIEISTYMLLYVAFLGAPWLVRQEGHVKVDLLTERLSPRGKEIMTAATSVLGLLAGLVLAWFGTLLTLDSFRRGVRVTNILNTPQWMLIAVIPVGGLFVAIEFARRGWRAARGKRADESDSIGL